MKLVILERDGTINHEGDPFITSAEDWAPLPGALDAIAQLNHAGFHVVIASNQPGLARKSSTGKRLAQINHSAEAPISVVKKPQLPVT